MASDAATQFFQIRNPRAFENVRIRAPLKYAPSFRFLLIPVNAAMAKQEENTLNHQERHMSHFHAVVWIDHSEARVFHFNVEATDKLTLKSHHSRKKQNGSQDARFLHVVAKAVSDAGEILITGPGEAKTELIKHIGHHDEHLLSRICGVEPADHPSDGQIVAHARRYFGALDRTTTQKAV